MNKYRKIIGKYITVYDNNDNQICSCSKEKNADMIVNCLNDLYEMCPNCKCIESKYTFKNLNQCPNCKIDYPFKSSKSLTKK